MIQFFIIVILDSKPRNAQGRCEGDKWSILRQWFNDFMVQWYQFGTLLDKEITMTSWELEDYLPSGMTDSEILRISVTWLDGNYLCSGEEVLIVF
jgi:hypothetical protein